MFRVLFTRIYKKPFSVKWLNLSQLKQPVLLYVFRSGKKMEGPWAPEAASGFLGTEKESSFFVREAYNYSKIFSIPPLLPLPCPSFSYFSLPKI